MDRDDLENYDPQQELDVDMDFGFHDSWEFDFLPSNEPGVGDAGPGLQTAEKRPLEEMAKTHPVLDDDDDQRVVQVDKEAGRIY